MMISRSVVLVGCHGRLQGSHRKDGEEPWDAVRFANPLKFPMTTAPPSVLEGGRFPGQSMVTWTAPGHLASIKINRAPGTHPYRPAPPPAGNLAFGGGKGEDGFPRASASHSDRFGGQPENAIDGRIIFDATPMNPWTSYESPGESDWLEVDFGGPKEVGRAILHIYDDCGGVQAPKSVTVQHWDGSAWRDAENQEADPVRPTGGMANTVTFKPVTTSKIRVVFTHAAPAKKRRHRD